MAAAVKNAGGMQVNRGGNHPLSARKRDLTWVCHERLSNHNVHDMFIPGGCQVNCRRIGYEPTHEIAAASALGCGELYPGSALPKTDSSC
jgi:hypothetical protein